MSVGEGNYVWVDAHGYMARLSITPRHPSVTLTKNYFVASTNSFHNFEWDRYNPLFEGKQRSEDYRGACPRYERLVELLSENMGKIDLETTKAIFSDHKYGKAGVSLCRHAPNTPAVSDPTNYNIIVKPSLGKMWACEKQPCETMLKDYQIVSM